MLKSVSTLIALFTIISAPVWAQLTITGKSAASIDSIIKDKTLVTIVLKENFRDVNLQINKIEDILIKFTSSDGTKSVYRISDIKEIQVQESRYAEKNHFDGKVALTRAEQKIVKRAVARAEEWFNQLNGNSHLPHTILSDLKNVSALDISHIMGTLKMDAALLLAVSGKEEHQSYLEEIVENGDIDSAIFAATYLMQTGAKIPDELIKEAFLNGERTTRADAAGIVGYTDKKNFLLDLQKMSKDPSPETYPSSIRALGMLGDRESLAEMYKGLSTLSQPKAEAAIFALTQLGGDDMIAELNRQYTQSKNIEKFRILRLLYVLGDADAANRMRDIGLSSFAYNKVVALVLIEHSDWDGVNWIREYLNKPTDPNRYNLFYRAYAAKALYIQTPNESLKILQELSRITPTEIYAKGHNKDEPYKAVSAMLVHTQSCKILGSIADKSMLRLLANMIEDKEPMVSLAACEAIIKTVNIDFRERSNDFLESQGVREHTLENFFK